MPSWTKEQKEAIERSNSNIIVSAGAGSGKTAVLSERVINKIENNIHVNELLILTFTRAAADEMKNRIRKKISKNEAYKEELNLLNSAYITTFDSFALSVVKKYHYLLNITSNIDITDESIVKIQKKKLLDETFEELYENQTDNFTELIDKYCVKNDNSLRENVSKLADKINEIIDKENYVKYIKEEFFTDENIEKIIEEYKIFIEDKKEFIKLEIENLNQYFDYDYIQKLTDSCLNILNSDIDTLPLYTTVKLPAVPKGSEEEAKEAKSNLKKLLDDLLEYGKYGDSNAIRNDVKSTKNTIYTLLDIVEKYSEKIKKYKEENDIYTFSDIATLAIKVLKENEEVRNELKYSFKEIMIDEYQDTNDVQETFIGLIANNNVYMVGDIKQSIYRFRGSNPNIFKDKYDSYSQNINGYKIDLIKNFRSREEVLDNINRLFDLIMDNTLGGADYKATHEMVFGNTSYNDEKLKDYNYDFEILEYTNNPKETTFTNSEVEIFAIAQDIKDKMNNKLKVFDKETSILRDATYNDFVIILDRSKYFDDFKKIFEYFDIPLTILKDGKLNTSIDILLIKNIVDIIIRISNHDYGVEFKYDFMSIGRSFLYEYTDSYLFEIISQNAYKETKLFKDFEKIENINSKSSSEIFNEILDITDFYNKINKVGDYENINVRLSTINSLSSNLSNLGFTIEDFKDYLSTIIEENYDIKYTAFSGDSDSVKILTIHKSKGLEYPVCYFADLDHEFNMSDIKDKFIVDRKYGLIVPSMMEENDTTIIKELYKHNYSKEEISEKIRLFYVALTRAREKMIIVIPEKEVKKLEKDENGVIDKRRRLKFNKLSNLIYAVKPYLYQYFKSIDITKLSLTKNYLYSKPINEKMINDVEENINVKELNIEKEIIEESHFSKITTELLTKESIINMEYGTKIHEILELIDFKNFNPSLISDEFIKNKISKFLSNDLLKNIDKANIYKEYEFLYQKNNYEYHGVIDLMLEYENNIDIIDYKLKNIIDNNYIKQLNGYKEYVENLSDKKVNTYLYSILDETITKIN